MEQITKRDGRYYYGERLCDGVDGAYAIFRADYNESLGKNVYDRLGRLGGRKERIHGYGFVFSEEVDFGCVGMPTTIPYRIIGLIGISYCRIIGLWDMQGMTDDNCEDYMDYILASGRGRLRLVGRKDGSTRSKRKRYR